MGYKHLFGPVASRRLGVSLGVDLVVHKVCSLDCVYCECGKTTDLTMERKAWVPFDRVRDELDRYWAENDDPDYITFSGSGEPCLNKELGRVIAYIKDNKPDIRVAVLTNATLLPDPTVRSELLRADLVVPSLDGVSNKVFQKINRPCASLDPEDIIDGIQIFAREFKGKVNLEIFILPGVNDSPEDIALFKTAISKIKPDLVQLNSLDRPGTCDTITPASWNALEKVRQELGPAGIEIIARVPKPAEKPGRRQGKDLEKAVLETVHRRPSTCRDLSDMLGADPEIIQALLDAYEASGKVESREQARGIFYQTLKDDA
jgi:wyosine [tRNA(Phe)-imidazoG37] synthetase (radical SAM superfamily)